MKTIFTTFIAMYFSIAALGQFTNNQLNDLIKNLKAGGNSSEQIKNTINGIINNPDLYNSVWKEFIDQAMAKDSARWLLLKDFNIQFKTFQTEENPTTSMGFSYDFNYDYANYSERNQKRISNSFGLSLKGNVAFNKKFNPADFLESKVNYCYTHFSGGVVTQHDTAIFTQLNIIREKLANIEDMTSQEAVGLWEELGQKLVMSNQYYYGLSPKFAIESNQDFTKYQFTPGIAIELGAKAWSNNNTLSKLNIFDYPFALLRRITGTDRKFTVYGSTIPTAQIVFDYVIPTEDTARSNLTGNSNPFPRIKFEAGFRTFITRVASENIFFNANYRFYHEIGAPETIKNADLDKHSFFVMALQSSSGFYASYSNGKLPFDAQNDVIYSIGFSYKFN